MESETYLRSILTGLISYPTDLQIQKSADEMGVLLTVAVNRADMGKIIGKEGGTAKAVRHLMNCLGYSVRQKISIKILEPVN